MATHSGVLAWRIPGTGSLVGCRLWGRTESDTTKATQQQQQQHSNQDSVLQLKQINKKQANKKTQTYRPVKWKRRLISKPT